MPRIGIFSECYEPVLNGVVVSIETFRQELERLGYNYFIFTTDNVKKENQRNVFRIPAMLKFEAKGGRYPIAWPQRVGFWARKAKELRLDLIHSQHLLNVGALGLRVAQKIKIPAILTYHTLLAEYGHYVPFFGNLYRQIIKQKSRDYCNEYNQIVTPSMPMKEILISYGVTTPIEVIPTGINLEKLQNPYPTKVIRAKWDIPEHQKILLYVSRIAKEKNIGFLIEAMKQLVVNRRKKYSRADVHLLIVGGGPELAFYQDLVEETGLSPYVTFTDMLKKEITNRYYGAADLFVFPSVTETQGIVVSEAMAAGLPAIAINKMGPRDIIKNGEDGFLTHLNRKEFVARIESLLDNEKMRRNFSEAAKENAKEFSSKNCALKMKSLYEKNLRGYNCNRSQ